MSSCLDEFFILPNSYLMSVHVKRIKVDRMDWFFIVMVIAAHLELTSRDKSHLCAVLFPDDFISLFSVISGNLCPEVHIVKACPRAKRRSGQVLTSIPDDAFVFPGSNSRADVPAEGFSRNRKRLTAVVRDVD